MYLPAPFLIIVRGANSDLTLVDFSFAGYSFEPLDSPKIDDYLNAFGKKSNFDWLEEIRAKHIKKFDPYYVILPLAFDHVSWNKAMRCFWLLKIVYPSQFQCICTIRYALTDSGHLVEAMKNQEDKEFRGDNLHIPEPELPHLNQFLRLAFERFGNADGHYISGVVDHYLQSYQGAIRTHRYLSLAMAIETILPKMPEITYRVRRTVAVLLGESRENCERLYKQVNDLYSLRSEIIHGESFDLNKVRHYLPVIEGVVSRLLIELLVHNVPTKQQLADIVTATGYNCRESISDGYQKYILNYNTHLLITAGFPAYKKPLKEKK